MFIFIAVAYLTYINISKLSNFIWTLPLFDDNSGLTADFQYWAANGWMVYE